MITSVYAESISSNPLFAGVIVVLLGVMVTVTGTIIGMFMKMSSMATTLRDMQEDIKGMSTDPDIMRWSTWAQRDTAQGSHDRRRNRRRQ